MRYLVFLLLFPIGIKAQDLVYSRKVVDTLSSPYMEGRGYVNNGIGKAAEYIGGEFAGMKLKSFGKDYFQPFYITVNTFPGKMRVKLGNDPDLIPGLDFLVGPYSHGVSGNYKVCYMDKATFMNKKLFHKFMEEKPANCFVLINMVEFNTEEKMSFGRELFADRDFSAGLILLNDGKLTWGDQEFFTTTPIIELDKKRVGKIPENITIEIENQSIDNYRCFNVCGYVEGSEKPDSFIVFTAHYDHLGRMGADTYFPGANDNASGTSMLLTLANHYSKLENKPKYSMVFIAFAGEEMGLLGSRYFTENPLFSLKQIKQLINMDIVGTGDEGITLVNAPNNKELYNKMMMINEEKKYLPKILSRDNTQNSDHFPFTEKKVHSVFIYTMGGSKAYHDVEDTGKNLSMLKFGDLFKLLTESTQ